MDDLQAVSLCGEQQQIRTLLSNAIKFSPDGGQVQLKVRTQDNAACIDVIDTGPGISSEERGQIFEPFFQGQQRARGHVKGTGLGLAIAQRYARLHRGSIEAQACRSGAHLRVTLPLAGTH